MPRMLNFAPAFLGTVAHFFASPPNSLPSAMTTIVQLDAAALDQAASGDTEITSSSSSSESSSSSASSAASTSSSDASAASRAFIRVVKKPTFASASHDSDENGPEVAKDDGGSKHSKSSFGFLDSIKRSSSKLNHELKKRISRKERKLSSLKKKGSMDSGTIGSRSGMTFTTIAESLSSSSEELSVAVFKTFSMLQEAHLGNFDPVHEVEYEDDDDDESYGFGSNNDGDAYGWHKIAFPNGKDKGDIALKASTSEETEPTSPASSEATSQCDESSRDVSLFDEYSDESSYDSEYGSDSDSDDDRTFQTTDSMFYDDFADLDAFAVLGETLYSMGTCNFESIKSDLVQEVEEEQTVATEGATKMPAHRIFPAGAVASATSTKPKKPGFFESMFACHG